MKPWSGTWIFLRSKDGMKIPVAGGVGFIDFSTTRNTIRDMKDCSGYVVKLIYVGNLESLIVTK
jgi:dTDP-D-glucose 4,6-dehydratase